MKPHIHIISDKYDIVYSLESQDDVDLVNAVLHRLVPAAIPQAGEFVVVPRTERRKSLRIEAINGGIVITLPPAALKAAAEFCYDLWNAEADVTSLKIIDQIAFAKDVARELCREEEDGTTSVHRMFDAAFIAALENGCEGVDHDAMLAAATKA